MGERRPPLLLSYALCAKLSLARGLYFTGHAAEQMERRNISPDEVEAPSIPATRRFQELTRRERIL